MSEPLADRGPASDAVEILDPTGAVVAAYFLFNLAIGLYYKSRAAASVSATTPGPAWSPA